MKSIVKSVSTCYTAVTIHSLHWELKMQLCVGAFFMHSFKLLWFKGLFSLVQSVAKFIKMSSFHPALTAFLIFKIIA